MTRFATEEQAARDVRGPISSSDPSLTYEGGEGHLRTAKSDLFLTGVRNFVGQDDFYESGDQRDARFNALVHQVTREDPAWVAGFIRWLRSPEANMRTAAIVAAVEYVQAGGPNGRAVISSAVQRPDELAETLGYWRMVAPGRPKGGSWPIKRGLADAFTRLIDERQALKYDSVESAWRLGDVMSLVRATPKDAAQAQLFRYIRDRQFRREDSAMDLLPRIQARKELMALPLAERRDLVEAGGELIGILFKRAAMSWEDVGAWLQGPMTAKAWEAIIPSMGYMALIRNLRNYEQAGVSQVVLAAVLARIQNPEAVQGSRQFPLRFYSAWKAGESMTFASAIENALSASTANVPAFPGKTLVLVDMSASMTTRTITAKSKLKNSDASRLFGSVVAVRSDDATLVGFGSTSAEVRRLWGGSILRQMEEFDRINVGHSTLGWTALQRHWDNHDRVLIFTDEQMHDSASLARPMSAYGKVYLFQLGGYDRGMGQKTGHDNVFTFGGMTDATFKLMAFTERGRDAKWPWE